MEPIEFKHQNIVYAADQPPYRPLPALKLDTPEGEVITCWKLNFRERIQILLFGRVWLSLLSFNRPINPSTMSTDRKKVYTHPDDNIPWYKKL